MTRALVRTVLSRATDHQWTLQGFGMFRLNLERVGRIHVWDDRFAVPNVSIIHTHPWALRSTIISGVLENVRYGSMVAAPSAGNATHMRQTIATGEGGGLRGIPVAVKLVAAQPEVYGPGMMYEQQGDEIHASFPRRGCVTLLERPKGEPLEHAFVYWPLGTEWVSAEPRPALPGEVRKAIGYALDAWE